MLLKPMISVLFQLSLSVYSLNILVYNPQYGKSHTKFMGEVADILVEEGHKVTVLIPILDPSIKGSGTKLAEVITLPTLPSVANNTWSGSTKDRWKQQQGDMWKTMQVIKVFLNMNGEVCNDALLRTDLMDDLKNRNFDIAFTEPFEMCGYAIFHKIGIKRYNTIFSTVLGNAYANHFGIPIGLSWVPGMSSVSTEKMSFRERFNALISFPMEHYITGLFATIVDDYIQQTHQGFPNLMDLMLNSSIVFINSEPLVDFPHPTMHNLVYIGGLTVPKKSEKALSEEWMNILSLRPQSILISFGSMSKSVDMPMEYKRALMNTMKRFPSVTFIWKYEDEEDEIVKEVENLVVKKWVPQAELLSSPLLTGFITHGGMASTNEITLRGKKSVVIPLFGDQYHNARILERGGGAEVYEKNELGNEEKLYGVVKKLVEDEGMAERAQTLAEMIEKKPFTPREQLMRYTQFSASYGPFPQLHPYSRHLSFIQLYLLDVLAVIVVGLFLSVFTITYGLRKLVRVISSKKKVE